MNRDYITRHSENLGRDMNVIVYGNAGYPMIAFPTQDSPCTNYEDFGMIDNLADYIEQGRIQLVCVDSVDKDSWSKLGGDKLWRADVQEAYYHYVCDELVPFVHEVNHSDLRPLTTGCSMSPRRPRSISSWRQTAEPAPVVMRLSDGSTPTDAPSPRIPSRRRTHR